MNNFFLSKKSTEDLADIWMYTYYRWSEKQADAYFEMILNSCKAIAKFPKLYGKNYDYVRDGLRGFKSNKHIIFYEITSELDIEIIRILHESMDYQRHLK